MTQGFAARPGKAPRCRNAVSRCSWRISVAGGGPAAKGVDLGDNGLRGVNRVEREDEAKLKQDQPQEKAAQHVAEAHHLLKGLRERLDRHPELDEAIERLEMALSALTIKTGGML